MKPILPCLAFADAERTEQAVRTYIDLFRSVFNHAGELARTTFSQAEIDTVQGWTALGENLHPAWGHLNARLGHAQGVQLSVAARLFLASRSGFLDSYAETCRRHHGAEAQATVFDPPEPARLLINRWVATQTRDHIPELLAAGSTTLVLR